MAEDESIVADLVDRIKIRHKREADEAVFGPPPEYPYDLTVDRTTPNPGQATDAVSGPLRELGTAASQAWGLDRPGGPVEGMINMLPIRPEHRPPAIGARVLDAPFKMAEAATQQLFRPVGELLKAAGVPDEWIEAASTALGLTAQMALPVNAAGVLSAKGTSALGAAGEAAFAAERGGAAVAREAGRRLNQPGLRGEPGPTFGMGLGGAQQFVPKRGVEDVMTEFHGRTGGSTFNPRTGENMAGAKEYAVGILSDMPGRTAKIPGKVVTREQFQQFLSQNADVLSNPSTRVGSWYDAANDTSVLDVVVTSKDKAVATFLGKKYDQQGIFDLSSIDPKTGKPIRDGYIPTGGSGEGRAQGAPASAMARVNSVPRFEQRAEKIRTATKDDFLIDNAPVTRAQMVQQAENQPWWYDMPKLKAKFGDDYDTFVGFLAGTSANRKVDANIKLAEKAYQWWVDAGRPTGDAARAFQPKDLAAKVGLSRAEGKRVLSILTGDPITKHDVKVSNFLRALRGDQDAVVLDLWMARAYGVDEKRFGDPLFYETVANMVREEASAIGITPRQFQERVWVGLKYLTEGTMPPSFEKAILASPAERKALLKTVRRKSDPEARHALYTVGSMLLGGGAAAAGTEN